jgi:TetR/AcrR family transcriptional repressor of nem operon
LTLPNRRDRTREKIIESARRLFNRHGFDRVSIDQIMASAGLTRGPFYTYFSSKSDLYAEVLTCFLTSPGAKSQWKGVHVDLGAADAGPQIVRAYLSRQHLEAVENACPMVALPSDVARSGEAAKRAFELVFKAMVDLLRSGSLARRREDRTAALGIAALCIGGMVTARALDDRALADELRRACTAVALRLGGWKVRRSRSPRP